VNDGIAVEKIQGGMWCAVPCTEPAAARNSRTRRRPSLRRCCSTSPDESVVLGTMIFEGAPPFEFVVQRGPKARAINRSVVLTLPVFLPEAPQHIVEIQVILGVEDAVALAATLEPAITMAKANEKA